MNSYRVGYTRKLIRTAHQSTFDFIITGVPCTCCLLSDEPVAQIGKRKAIGFVCVDCLSVIDGDTVELDIIKSVQS